GRVAARRRAELPAAGVESRDTAGRQLRGVRDDALGQAHAFRPPWDLREAIPYEASLAGGAVPDRTDGNGARRTARCQRVPLGRLRRRPDLALVIQQPVRAALRIRVEPLAVVAAHALRDDDLPVADGTP